MNSLRKDTRRKKKKSRVDTKMTARVITKAIDGNPELRAGKAEFSDREKASGDQRGKLPIRAIFNAC